MGGRLRLLFRCVILVCAGALQDMQIKSGEGDVIETQRFRTVGQQVLQIGACPVENRHKVVAHGIDTAGRQITQRLLVIGDMPRVIAAVGFDLFMHRNAFHHRPHQPFLSQQRLSRLDLIDRPNFAIRDMVQCGDDAGGTGLAHIVKRDRIVRPVPTPCLFHCVSL
ncbi:hypothetical protein D3C79_217480 [compost metagenome]